MTACFNAVRHCIIYKEIYHKLTCISGFDIGTMVPGNASSRFAITIRQMHYCYLAVIDEGIPNLSDAWWRQCLRHSSESHAPNQFVTSKYVAWRKKVAHKVDSGHKMRSYGDFINCETNTYEDDQNSFLRFVCPLTDFKMIVGETEYMSPNWVEPFWRVSLLHF